LRLSFFETCKVDRDQKGSEMLRLPGLIDPHVHLREPGATHKEDWMSGTAAALAGGFTAVLAMPNTAPPVCDEETLSLALTLASQKAHCDYAQFVGAGADNAFKLPKLAKKAAGMKMYLDQTYGPLRLTDQAAWCKHFERWPINKPLCVHAESETLAAVLKLAVEMKRPVHFCHVSRRDEICRSVPPKNEARQSPVRSRRIISFSPKRISPPSEAEDLKCVRAWQVWQTKKPCGITWTS
jgi:dihydroorotase-like cyclic amidohydrolase